MNNTPEWDDFRYSASDGLALAGRKYGWNNPSSKPAIVCLAGLTRNSRDFHELALFLSSDAGNARRVLCLDYRGRGLSAYDSNSDNYNPLTEAEDVINGMTAAGIGEADIIGTSRGGIIAMILAAMRPSLLHSVVLNDVGPQIDAKGLVRIKSYMHRSKRPDNMAQAVENLKSYASAQFPKFSDEDWEKQANLIYEEKDGKLQACYDPGLIKSLEAINLDAPLPTMWPQFSGLKNIPVMVVHGENSDLLSLETVKKMQQEHRGLQVLSVADQGHAPDLGAPRIAAQIAMFLKAA